MPTPMFVYNEIAARFGVDPANEDEVDRFFNEILKTKSKKIREEVLLELFRREGEEEPTENH